MACGAGVGWLVLATAACLGVLAAAATVRAADAHANVNAATTLTFDLKRPTTPFPHYWEKCVGSGHALLALRADYQQQMATATIDLGFQYVRFHGLLNDDMSTYTIINGVPTYSFFNVDQVMDFLLDIQMRPIVELSFMPLILASGNATQFHYDANITPPKLMSEWSRLVSTLVSHLVDRYGLAEIQQWYFECWNEPNLFHTFWTGTQLEYFQLYEATALAVKGVDKSLRVGGPATAASGWIPEFVQYVTNRNVPIDFVSTHEYPTDLGVFTRDMMKGVMTKTRAAVPAHLPLFYTEYNDGLYATPAFHDTPFAAAFIAKTVADMQGVVQATSWWTFSDVFEEQGFASTPFFDPNGWGLLSRHGIPKPSYRAFQLLHMGGNDLLPLANITYSAAAGSSAANAAIGGFAMQGDDCIVRTLNVFVYSYDDPLKPLPAADVSVMVQSLGAGVLPSVRLTRLDSRNSNAPAAWLAMGKPQYPSKAQIAALQSASQLVSRVVNPIRVSPTAVQLNIDALEGNSLALLTITWPM